jgi:hypothetical protein
MTLAEVIALVQSLSTAVAGVAGLVATQQKRISELEAQVQLHDAQLHTAPPPGPQKG